MRHSHRAFIVFPNAFQCVGIRQCIFNECVSISSMRKTYKNNRRIQFASCTLRILKRQQHMEAVCMPHVVQIQIGEICENVKSVAEIYRIHTNTFVCRKLFRCVKLPGNRENGNVLMICRQYRVLTSTGWIIQQNRVKYHRQQQTEENRNLLQKKKLKRVFSFFLSIAVCVRNFIWAQKLYENLLNDLHAN